MTVEIISHPAADPNAVLKPVGPGNANAELPAAEKPEVAPDVANEAEGKPVTPGQEPAAKGKNAKAPLDKKDESSSKKKKGLEKLNPF